MTLLVDALGRDQRFGGSAWACNSTRIPCPVWYDDPRPCAPRQQAFSDSSGSSVMDVLGRVPAGFLALLCILFTSSFSLAIRWRYNHVLVVHRRVRTRAVSNTCWLYYFLMVALQAWLQIARIVYSQPGSTTDIALFYAEMCLRSIGLAVLCTAIDYQIRHRSNPTFDGGGSAVNGPAETKLLLGRDSTAVSANEHYTRQTLPVYALTGVGLAFNIGVLLFDALTHLDPKTLEWAYLGSMWILLLMPLYFVARVFRVTNAEDGPTFGDKMALFLGVAVIALCDGLPPSGWKWILPQGCELSFLTWYNIIEFFKIVGCILLFVFMRREYQRSKETCIHLTVGHVRHSTGGRHVRY